MTKEVDDLHRTLMDAGINPDFEEELKSIEVKLNHIMLGLLEIKRHMVKIEELFDNTTKEMCGLTFL